MYLRNLYSIKKSLLVGLAGLAYALSPVALAGDSSSRPNVVILLADDMGYGDLSSYGHPNIVTPHLDDLANEGVKLTSFYAGQAVCTPSRAALLTGRYAIRSNMTQVQFPNSKTGIPESEVTIAEMLQDAGYQTAMVGKWHLGDNAPHLPTNNGFEDYYGLLYSNDMIPPWVVGEDYGMPPMPPLTLYRNETPDKEVTDQSILTTTYTDEAVKQIASFKKDEPFFLYVSYAMPHLPVAAPQSQQAKSKGGLYGAAVQTIDWSVGQVLAALEENKVLDNTLVIFISDNGPWQNLPDRMVTGGVKPWHVGSSGTLKGSKGTTYEGGTRVPAIMYWAKSKQSGIVSSELATAMDLLPTIQAVSEAPFPADITLDGKSLLPLLAGGSTDNEDKSFFYFRGDVVEAVRDRQWKLRVSPLDEFAEETQSGSDSEAIVELYNLEEDPSERFNVATSNPQEVDRLYKELVEFAASTEAKYYKLAK